MKMIVFVKLIFYQDYQWLEGREKKKKKFQNEEFAKRPIFQRELYRMKSEYD